jgi:hypothetical protein
MAKITFTIESGQIGTLARTYDIADTDVPRIVAWAMSVYAPSNSLQDEPLPFTPNEALAAMVQGLVDTTLANVTAYEREQALKAISEPTPIVVAVPAAAA